MKNNKSNETIAQIYHLYSNMVFRIALQNLKNLSEAEDITQEVFCAYIKHSGFFKSKDHEKAWFIRVTINKCKDYFKSGYHRTHVCLSELLSNQLSVSFSDDELFVEQELNKLEWSERNLIYLYYYEDMTTKEIAKILHRNESTIRSQLSRARQKIKVNLEEKGK